MARPVGCHGITLECLKRRHSLRGVSASRDVLNHPVSFDDLAESHKLVSPMGREVFAHRGRSARPTTAIMPTPMLNVRYISAASTFPSRWM